MAARTSEGAAGASRPRVPVAVVAIGFGLVLAVALALPVTPISKRSTPPNLAANGSFEEPVVGAGQFEARSTGESIAGWRVVGARGTVGVVSTAFVQNGLHFDAKDGNQWLDLTGSSNTATGVAQTFQTEPGHEYRLSFAVGNVVDPGGLFGLVSAVDVFVNGRQVLVATNAAVGKGQVWKTFAMPVRPRSSSTTVAFLNGDPNSDNSNGLDAVELVER